MWLRNRLITSIVLLTVVFGQSMINTYGIGNRIGISDPASLGTSSAGLLPSFREGVSLINPVTWNKLSYAYISLGYKVNHSKIEIPAIENEITGVGKFQLIVPMKNTYAFGLTVTPYLDRYFLLQGPETAYIDPVFQDTLSLQKTISGYGGINSLSAAFSFPLTEHERMAVSLEYLFGSSRGVKTLRVNELDYIQKERDIYNGVLFHVYFHSQRLKFKQYDVGAYLSFSSALSPISLEQHIYHPFEDATTTYASDLGNYDSWDFPSPSLIPSPVENIFENVLSPTEYHVGFDIKRKSVSFQTEWQHWQDNSNKAEDFSVIGERIQSSDHWNIGLSKFTPQLSRSSKDIFEYRFGLSMKRFLISSSEEWINEKGISFGIGIQFGPMKNQVDFGYSLAVRNGLYFENEIIQYINVGLSIGDLWFVKRRQR